METTVTIKYGKGYEETWAVFKGEIPEIRQQVIDYFGLTRDVVAEYTLHELVVNVTDLAHGTGNAAALLGAVVIPASQSGATAVVEQVGNPWAGLGEGTAEEAPVASQYQHVIDAFATATDVTELQKVWAANQSAFGDEAVVTAYKARGKELSSK